MKIKILQEVLNSDASISFVETWVDSAELVSSTPDPTPIPTGTTEMLNLSSKFALLTRGGAVIPCYKLIQGVLDGPEARIQGRITINGTYSEDEDDNELPGGEWALKFVGDLKPERKYDVYKCAVGAMKINRGYHQRGVSGGNVHLQIFDENDANSEIYMEPVFGMLETSQWNRLENNYPIKWERGDSFTFELRFQRIV